MSIRCVDAVEAVLVELAGEVQLHAVRQVTAVGEVEAQQSLPRGHQRVQHRGVGLGARVRLDVGEVGVEQRFGAVARDVFHLVDVLTTAVVTPTGQPLCVLVGQHAALRLQNRARHEVLRRDHLQGVSLPAEFLAEQLGDVGVDFGQRGRHKGRVAKGARKGGSTRSRSSSHDRQCIGPHF
jgi:hypothetical protein